MLFKDMNVEIYIHGTTEGYDAYTTAIDKDQYIQTFYGAEYNDQSLIVETKIVDSNIYCYYTYFRKNIQTYAGRSGRYIGITLRADCFVRNVQVMYQVMDMIYSQFITGSIVSDGDNRKFIVRGLKEINKKVVDQIVNLLSQIIQTKDIVKMDESFLGNAGAALSYNPCDNRCKDLVAEYKKAEKVIISPSSSLLREQQKAKEYQQKLEYIKKETEEKYVSRIKKMQADVKMLQKEKENALSELDNHIKQRDTLEKHVCALEMELQESKQKIKSLSDQANLKTELVKISEPLMRLNALLQRVGIGVSSQQKSQPSMRRFDSDFEKRRPEKVSSFKNSNIWKIALMIFALASILLLVVLFFQIKLYSKYNNSYVDEPKVENVQVGDIKEKEGQALTKIEDLKEFEQKKDELEDARIDIQGQNTYPDGLVAETRYPIGLVNKEGNYVDSLIDIKWDCRGGYIDPKHGNKVSLRTKQSGTIQILCFLPNGQTITRELKVYEKKTNQHSSSSIRKDSKITIPNPPSSISGKERSKSSDL